MLSSASWRISAVLAAVLLGTGEPALASDQPLVLHTTRKAALASAFSPTGSRFAVANDKRLWVFDTKSQKELGVFYSVEKIVHARHHYEYEWDYRYGTGNGLTFVSESEVATTGMGSMVSVWDTDRGKNVESINWPVEYGFPIALAWAPRNSVIAAVTGTGHIVMVRRGSNLPAKPLQGPPQSNYAVSFSHDERYVVATGNAGILSIWDLQNFTEVARIPSGEVVHDLGLLKPGHLLTAGDSLKIWDFLGGDEVGGFKNPSLGGQAAVVVLGALTLVSGTAALASAATPSPYSINSPSVGETAAAAAGTSAGIIVSKPWTTAHACKRAAATSPDGRWIVDKQLGLDELERIRVIDSASGEVVQSLKPRGSNTCDLKFSPDGSLLILVNSKGAHLFDSTTWKSKRIKLKAKSAY